MATPTFDIHRRDTSLTSSSSSAASSLNCSGKNAGLSQCEKPASSNALEIGLGVAIPVVVIILILSFFIIRNYRKEKREAMDHDPDFDENGDPTALPDLPAFSTDVNPFKVTKKQFAGNGGYPLMEMQNKSSHDVGSIDKRSIPAESFVDGFVLPYHNQTGSKASLDHFARQLGDHNSFNHHRKVSHSSASSINFQRANNLSERSSPLKSNLNTSSSHVNTYSQSGSPLKNKAESSSHLGYPSQRNLSNGLVPYNNSNSDVELNLSDRYRVDYEHERDHHDYELPGPTKVELGSATAYSATTEAADLSSEIVSIHDSDDDSEDEEFRKVNTSPTKSNKSNTSHSQNHANGEVNKTDDAIDESNMTTVDSLSPFDEKFAHQNLQHYTDLSEHERVHDESYSDASMDITQDSQSSKPLKKKELKVPRLSAFNMLQNVSDDESEDVSNKAEQKMTPEQEVELARMKSVYNVYFDRSNSVKSSGEPSTQARNSFQADASQPLPVIDDEKFKVNSNLRTDTNYDFRKTTNSSIYELPGKENQESQENGSYNNEYYGGYDQQPPSHQHNDHDAYNYDQENYNQSYSQPYHGQYVEDQYSYYNSGNQMHMQQYPQEPQYYGPQQGYDQNYPLQPYPMHQNNSQQRYYNTASARLPNASELRKSSLQTYTNFEPKQRVSSSPNVKQTEFSQGRGTLINSPSSSYALLSAAMMTTGAPISLQRKYKPAGAFPA